MLMKHDLLSVWLRALMLVAAVLCVEVTHAQTFAQDGFYYSVIKPRELRIDSSTINAGDLFIPAQVKYDRSQYTVVEIGNGAFKGKNIETITFPGTVRRIGDEAFSDCENVTNITFPSYLQYIGRRSFFSLPKLANVYIAIVDTIGMEAFHSAGSYSDHLGGVKIESSKLIGERAFMSAGYKDVYIISGRIAKDAFSGLGSANSLTLGDGVTFIGENAFANDENFESIVLGNSVDTISAGAFSVASSLPGARLKSLTIPASVKYIGNNAFTGRSPLSILSFADGKGRLKLGYATTEDGDEMFGLFSNCPIDSVYIGRDIEYNIYPSFYKLKSLRKIEFGNQVTMIPDRLFAGDDSVVSVKVPWTTPPMTIDRNVFSDSTYSKAVLNVPSGSSTLYGQIETWKNFKHRYTVKLDQYYSKGYWDVMNLFVGSSEFLDFMAFDSGLPAKYSIIQGGEHVEIEEVENGIILKGKSVGQVVIEVKQEGNDDYLPLGGSLVLNVYNKFKPDKVEVGDVFTSNIINDGKKDLLEYFEVTSLEPREVSLLPRGKFERGYRKDSVYGTVEIPASVEYDGCAYNVVQIGEMAFGEQSNVSSFKFNEGLREIEIGAFERVNVETFEFPNSMIVIGANNFFINSKLRTIIIGPNVKVIDNFFGWPMSNNYDKVCSIYSFNPLPPETGDKTFSYPDNNNEIPSDLTLYVPIGSKAAYEKAVGWRDLVGHIQEFSALPVIAPVITTRNDVLNITADDDATIYYTMDGSEPTTDSKKFTEPVQLSVSCLIKAIAVKDDEKSEVASAEYHNAKYPDITKVGDVFSANIINNGEENLLQYFEVTSMDPYEVELRRNSDFDSNWNYEDVSGTLEIPAAVEHNGELYNIAKVGITAYAYCGHITEIKLNEGLREIDGNAFRGCGMKTITLPNTVTKLGYGVFEACENLHTLILDSNLKEIISFKGWPTGGNYDKESYIYSLNPVPPAADDNLFIYSDNNNEIPEGLILYVPKGSKSAYETAPGWEKLFGHIVEFDPTAIESIKADVTVSDGYWYTLSGQRLAKAPVATGVYIHNGKKVVIK